MTARLFIVHDDPAFSQEVRAALQAAGHTVADFDDPMVALDALESAHQIELLITRANFGPGKLNGIALARMARIKQPDVRVLFTAIPEYESHAEGLGEFLSAPVHVDDVVEVAERLLQSPSENQT
jgi:DNA-binding NtrC family response regulator